MPKVFEELKDTTFDTFIDIVKNKYNIDELNNFQPYSIEDAKLYVEGTDGPALVIDVIKKELPGVHIKFKNGTSIFCSDNHLLNTTSGVKQVNELLIGDKVKTNLGYDVEIESCFFTETKYNFYDISINSADQLFYTSNGICHHNTGKTHMIEKGLAEAGLKDGSGYFKNTGSASAVGIYKMLFKYRKEIILFDDSDGALADQDSRNILKAATDTKKVRKLAWTKESKNLVDPEEIDPEDDTDTRIPKYFEFEGKIIFISNLPIAKLDPDGALRTRGLIIDVNPTTEEVFAFMEKIVDDMPLEDGLKLGHEARLEVVSMLRKNTRGEINLRKLVRGLNMRAVLGAGSDLERMLRLYA